MADGVNFAVSISIVTLLISMPAIADAKLQKIKHTTQYF